MVLCSILDAQLNAAKTCSDLGLLQVHAAKAAEARHITMQVLLPLVSLAQNA